MYSDDQRLKSTISNISSKVWSSIVAKYDRGYEQERFMTCHIRGIHAVRVTGDG